MFSIKVAYKGKNIALPRGTNSLLRIQDQLKNRFPGQFPNGVTFKYEDIQVESFEQLHTYVPTNKSNSLKIHAQPTLLTKSSQIKSKSPEPKIDIDSPTIQLDNKVMAKGEESIQEVEKPCSGKEGEGEIRIVEKEENVEEKNTYYSNENDVDCVETICIQLDKPQIPYSNTQSKAQNQIEQMRVEPIPKNYFHVTNEQESNCLQQQNIQTYPSYISNEAMGEAEAEELREIEPGVYQCVFCKELQLCNVCDTKRKIGQNSKLIKIINKIVERKIDEKVEERLQKIGKQISELNASKNRESSLLQQQISIAAKQEQIQIFSSSILREEKKKLIDNIEEIHGDFEGNKKDVGVGEEFSWMFNIKLKNHFLSFPQQVQIMDNKNLKVMKTFEMEKRETIVEVGPFKAEKEGQMERTFRLSYTDGEEITLFGPKFGFNVHVMRERISKILSNRLRNDVERIKKALNKDKSTEYLISKLKEVGISGANEEYCEELLTDILRDL